MKKLALFLLLLTTYYLLLTTNSYAQTATAKPTSKLATTAAPTEESKIDVLSEQITNLKERIASRVAELQLVERRGIIGRVTEVKDKQITLTDIQDNIRFVDVDELTKFASLSKKESFGISDITKGTKISAIGLYNKQSRRLQARFVSVFVIPTIVNGAIQSLDKADFSLKIMSENGKETNVDVEAVSKTNSYTKENGVARSGFSKLEVGWRIVMVGYPDKKNPARILASRILILSELPENPKINLPSEALSNEGITPSTGSGKKITPVR
ncbi:MAG: hypothetical protein HY428_02730 [Candidatus Levybacteria bacterium]|nr:hypothetical protein [Candidatus Levybacteria bacterium]